MPSPQYKQAIASSTRSTVAEIRFGIYDVTAKSDAAISDNGSTSFTNTAQLKDNVRVPLYEFATFEDDRFKLDGGLYLVPDDLAPSDTISWWSQALSGADCSYNPVPTLTINFGAVHSSIGIGIFFDPYADSYCTDFTITWYNGASVLDTVTISGNTDVEFNLSRNVSNYNKIVVQFLKSSKPYRYVKLMEINYGLEYVYTSDDIISASTVEELDPSNTTLSVNTLKFTLLNTDQQFNMINPQGLYAYLQKKQQILAKSGLLLPDGTYEYISLGAYYLSDWKNSTGITASLEATDAMGLMDKTTYYTSPFWVNATLDAVVSHILNDAGEFPYTIDSSLSGVVINGYIPIMSHREALQCLMIAACAVLKVDRDGIIRIVQPDYNTIDKTINYDAVIGTPTVEQKPLISEVDATEYTYTLNNSSETLYTSTFNLNGSSTIQIPYNKEPVSPSTVSVSVTGAGTLNSFKAGAVGASVNVTGTGNLTITVTGTAYTESSRKVANVLSNLSAGEVPQAATVEDNKLICGNGKAVTQYLLNYYQKRIKQTLDYWDDPTLVSGDCASVQTMFGNNQSGIVEHQEITFAPNLRATVEVTG